MMAEFLEMKKGDNCVWIGSLDQFNKHLCIYEKTTEDLGSS